MPQTKRETVQAEKRGMLGKVTPPIYRDVDVMMYSPITKTNEQIVNFTYSYCELRIPDTKLLQELSYPDTVTGRIGSRLDVMVPLPKSLADKLQKELTEDPRKVRGLVEALVKERGEVSPGVWDGSSNEKGLGVRPPSFVDDERRSPQAQQLAARPRIIVPVTKKAEDTQLSLEQRVFRVVA